MPKFQLWFLMDTNDPNSDGNIYRMEAVDQKTALAAWARDFPNGCVYYVAESWTGGENQVTYHDPTKSYEGPVEVEALTPAERRARAKLKLSG